jgi:hypothetical protein
MDDKSAPYQEETMSKNLTLAMPADFQAFDHLVRVSAHLSTYCQYRELRTCDSGSTVV